MEKASVYPGVFARFYDVIYNHARSDVDKDFYLRYINGSKGPVLEVGVGTGRIFIDALSSGVDIYGIDNSKYMLDVLKMKVNSDSHFRLTEQNAIDFTFDIKFDLIIAPFRLLMHIVEVDNQLKLLKNMLAHLNKGGKFIFDVFIPDMRQLIEGYENMINFDGEYLSRKNLRRYVSSSSDLIHQIMNITFRFEWDDNNSVKNETWHLPMRYFFRYELEHLIKLSQFKNYKLFGDFKENEINENSKEFIFVCTK